jgi:hypothetical protein
MPVAGRRVSAAGALADKAKARYDWLSDHDNELVSWFR